MGRESPSNLGAADLLSFKGMKSMFLRVALCFLLLNRTDSTGDDEFLFNGFQAANLSLYGIANTGSDSLLRLTNNTRQSKGQAFYPALLRFRPSQSMAVRSFSSTFVFAIVSQYPTISSYGFTFCISPSKELAGGVANYLGLFNSTNNGSPSNHIVGVEFDTIQTPEYRDIDDNHVGIDINGLTSINVHTAGYFPDDTNAEFQNLSLISGEAMQVWVEYDARELQLNVTLAPLGRPKPQRSLLSSTIGLSSKLLEDMYVGFTASEGNILTTHYILGWSFKMDGKAPALNLQSLPSLPRANEGKKSKALVIWLPISLSVLLLLLAAFVTVFVVVRRGEYAEQMDEWEQQYGPYRFAYKDLFQATNGFKDEWLLGHGGFGRVYRGVLPASRAQVAIKRLSHESRQGMREFIAEVVSLGHLRHRNLVRLLGYCRRKDELLLVYDFMPNGSLDKHLFSQNIPCLDWKSRFRIIKGVASGLLYLHEDWVKVVIHRDVKASNVLLDSEFSARLSDFGLARLYDHGSNPQCSRIVGTLGYLAPELARRGKMTTSTDVYAFGIFLLEVACGRRPIQQALGDENDVILVDLVAESWRNGDIIAASDSRLDGQFVVGEMELVLKLGMLCCHPMASERPSMRQVMQFLDGDVPLPQMAPSYLNSQLLPSVAGRFHDSQLSSLASSYVATASVLSGGR